MSLLRLEAMSPTSLALTVLDILIVAYFFYRIFLLIRGTRAVQLVKGILILVLATQVSAWLNLYTTHTILQSAEVALVVALPVVFQPELRRMLEQLGRGRFFTAASLSSLSEAEQDRVLAAVVEAADTMARQRVGALIVLEREVGLKDYIETGVPLDAHVSTALLLNLFVPGTPLHDGAVIVRGSRIAAAACFLPLAEGRELPLELGTRHRAAVGVTEQSDALAVVVSEETGTLALATGGRLVQHLDSQTLREMLAKVLRPSGPRLVRREVS